MTWRSSPVLVPPGMLASSRDTAWGSRGWATKRHVGQRFRGGLLDERFAFYLYFWRADNVVVAMGSSDFVAGQDEQAAHEIAKRIDHRARLDHSGS